MSKELAAAVMKGDVEEARALLGKGADPRVPAGTFDYPATVYIQGDAPLLHLAVINGNPVMVKLLLAHGVDVNERPTETRSYQTHDDTYEVSGYSALELAVQLKLLVVADVLLEAGAKCEGSTARRLKRLSSPAKVRKGKKKG